MESRTDQIKAILSGVAFHWAIKQLLPGESIDDKRYVDFISVDTGEIYEYVKINGFPMGAVEELRRGEPGYYYDCIRIEETDHGWQVYGIDRDQRSDIKTFPSLEDARKEVVQRRMISAKIELNHRYRNAHPELNLPNPSQM